jgi:hypothetical protein
MSAVASCAPSGPKLYPVTGQVLFEGKPAEGAMVAFHPQGTADDRLPGARVGADGTFTLRTFPYGEGAPEGEYAVGVTWLYGGTESAQPKNKLPGRYADAATSGLKAAVKPGPNALEPFKLSEDD